MTLPIVFPRFNGDALCATTDPEAFFPDTGGSVREAKRTCSRCELRDPCLAWAMEHQEAGVWGGTSETERRNLRKNQRRRTGRPTQPIDHGTERGAAQHRRRGEVPCAHCAQGAHVAWTLRQNKDECPVCGDWMLKSSIRRHVERRHPNAEDAA